MCEYSATFKHSEKAQNTAIHEQSIMDRRTDRRTEFHSISALQPIEHSQIECTLKNSDPNRLIYSFIPILIRDKIVSRNWRSGPRHSSANYAC